MTLLAALGLAAFGLAADTGTIIGTVSSASTHNGLQGAIVTVPALNRTAGTDSTGRFVLADVPAGTVEVVVAYTGFTDFRQSVTVGAGETVRFQAAMKSSEAVTMAPYTVSAVREGQALAITEQRNAANVKDVVAIDAWGNLPNMSVGELAMRMPGISVPSGNGLDDDNVVMNVSIRGMDPNLTRLNIDGLPVVSVSGTGRTASLHSFTGAMYEQIEVNDSATPDMSPDSIGGQINLKTRSPLNMNEDRRMSYTLGMRWAPPFWYRTPERAVRDLHPSGQFTYMQVFDIFGGRRNLGVSVNTYYSELVNMIDYRQFNYAAGFATGPAPINNFSSTTGLDSRHYESISLRADYRYSEASRFFLSLIFNRGAEPNYDQTVLTATGTVAPGYTDDRTTLTAGSFTLSNAHWSFYSQNPTFTFHGEHKWDRLSLDYSARYSYMHFDSGSGGNGSGGSLTYRVPSVGLTIDKSDPNGKILMQNTGANIYSLANYTSTISFTKRDASVDQPQSIAVINAAYDLDTKYPVTLRAGLSARENIWNYQNRNPQSWSHVATPFTALPGVLMPLSAFDVQNGGPGRLPEVDPRAVNIEANSRPDIWTEDLYFRAQQKYNARRYVDEKLKAGYAMAQGRIGKFGWMGGVRTESADESNWAFLKVRSTSATAVPDPVQRAAADYSLIRNSTSNTKSFPSVNLSYDITRNIVARAAWSTSFARPNYALQVPTVTANDTAQTVTGTNGNLLPEYSKNLDFRLDYYMPNSGVLTVGYFTKKITDYLVTQDTGTVVGAGNDNGFGGSYTGYRLFEAFNAGNVDVKGWQINYQQQLTFLPSILKGITLTANYTKLTTEGDFGGTAASGSTGGVQTSLVHLSTENVVGFTPETANVMAVYNYHGFTTRVIANYVGKYISTYTPASATNPTTTGNLYRKALTTVNAGISYRYSPALSYSVDATNVFQQGPTFYRYVAGRARELRRMPSAITFSINGQF